MVILPWRILLPFIWCTCAWKFCFVLVSFKDIFYTSYRSTVFVIFYYRIGWSVVHLVNVGHALGSNILETPSPHFTPVCFMPFCLTPLANICHFLIYALSFSVITLLLAVFFYANSLFLMGILLIHTFIGECK